MASHAAREIRNLLQGARGDMLSILIDDLDPGERSPTDYDRFLAQQKLQAIDGALSQLEGRALAVSDVALEQAAEQGVQDLVKSINRLEVATPVVVVDVNSLALVKDLAAAQIRGVFGDVKTTVNVAMTRAMAGAIGFRELQREIRDAFGGDVTAARIDRIIQTETVSAHSQAQAAADEKLAAGPVGEELIKVWDTTGRSNVRISHAMIHGQERELDQLFNVGGGATAATPPGSGIGEKANGPADPSLPAEEAVNCHCSILYEKRAKAKQPYIEKDPDKVRAARAA